jgi:predicted metal-binding membrane protein
MMTASWVPMMAAMMLPVAAPAIVRRARADDGALAAPLFAGAYLGIWLLAGLAVDVLYRPPGTVVAAALVVAGVLYELTPFARACRRRCRAERRSGARFGGWCVGSTAGLMAVLVALAPMSLPLMFALSAVALLQKELPA